MNNLYLESIIKNQELIISNNNEILTFLACLTFTFACFFIYFLIRNMYLNK